MPKRRPSWIFHSHACSTTKIARDFICFYSEHIRESYLKNSSFCIFSHLHTNAPDLSLPLVYQPCKHNLCQCGYSSAMLPFHYIYFAFKYVASVCSSAGERILKYNYQDGMVRMTLMLTSCNYDAGG